MTVNVALPPPAPDKYGSNPAAFDAAMQAWLNWQETATAQANAQNVENNAINANVNASALIAAQSAAEARAIAASPAVQNAASNAQAAQLAATQAQGFAAQAQAVSPDSPVRMNTRRITSNLLIPAGYNAHSAGPITIDDGVTVTVSNHSTWSIA